MPKKSADHAYALITNEFEDGNGFTLFKVAFVQQLDWHILPKSEGLESIPVSGESHHMDDLQHDCFKPGSDILLEHEPDNPYDKNAIAVWNKNHQYHVGYIPKEDAPRILKKLKKYEIEKCIVLWEIKKNNERVSLRLLLIGPDAPLLKMF